MARGSEVPGQCGSGAERRTAPPREQLDLMPENQQLGFPFQVTAM